MEERYAAKVTLNIIYAYKRIVFTYSFGQQHN